jgi:hypothetical protein
MRMALPLGYRVQYSQALFAGSSSASVELGAGDSAFGLIESAADIQRELNSVVGVTK